MSVLRAYLLFRPSPRVCFGVDIYISHHQTVILGKLAHMHVVENRATSTLYIFHPTIQIMEICISTTLPKLHIKRGWSLWVVFISVYLQSIFIYLKWELLCTGVSIKGGVNPDGINRGGNLYLSISDLQLDQNTRIIMS